MEENLYDTNRLIEIYGKGEQPYGYTTILNLIEFSKAIDFNLKVLYPSKSDYELALKISTELLKKGKPIPAVDSIIAAIAFNNNLKVITKDKHFLYVNEIMEEFKVEVDG
jgi:hypothetical protein